MNKRTGRNVNFIELVITKPFLDSASRIYFELIYYVGCFGLSWRSILLSFSKFQDLFPESISLADLLYRMRRLMFE